MEISKMELTTFCHGKFHPIIMINTGSYECTFPTSQITCIQQSDLKFIME